MVSIAAVLVLMVGSFTIGAIALAKESIVYVEVEKEQEIIKVGDSGITLILPDSWKDKYGYELQNNSVAVYHIATRETSSLEGYFFWVDYYEGQYPLDYIYPEPGFTIAITETRTYRMRYTSDIQANIDDPESWAEYWEMEAERRSIEIVITTELLENTMNASNWVQGTVFIEALRDDWQGARTFVFGEDQSKEIRGIFSLLDYSDVHGFDQTGYPRDLRIMFSGEEYVMNITTGFIYNANTGQGAALSAKDLSRIMDLLSD